MVFLYLVMHSQHRRTSSRRNDYNAMRQFDLSGSHGTFFIFMELKYWLALRLLYLHQLLCVVWWIESQLVTFLTVISTCYISILKLYIAAGFWRIKDSNETGHRLCCLRRVVTTEIFYILMKIQLDVTLTIATMMVLCFNFTIDARLENEFPPQEVDI